jgi:hypothetical protein
MRRVFALGIPFAFLVAGCTYDNGDANRALYDNPSPANCMTPTQSTIDTNAQIDPDAGIGIGVFIEYASGGHYHLRTSCDTTTSHLACHWDVILTPDVGKTITNVAPENLTGTDSVQVYAPNLAPAGQSPSYQLLAETSTEIDGVTFDIEPGSAVSVDAYVDANQVETCALPYFFWVGDGALHQGSPSNPLIVTPTPE